MVIKLKLKSGVSHQIYIAVFASVCAIIMFGIFIILAILSDDVQTIREAFIIMSGVVGINWLIFLLVRIILRTSLEVNEKGFVMRIWKKILWEVDWTEIEKIEFFQMPWNFFLSPNIYKGELVIIYKKDEWYSKERKVNLMQKDIKKINNEIRKDIKIN